MKKSDEVIHPNHQKPAKHAGVFATMPATMIFVVVAALLALFQGFNGVVWGLVVAAPVTLLGRWLIGHILREVDDVSGPEGVNLLLKHSVARMAFIMVAFVCALPFGVEVLLGVFLCVLFEVIVYTVQLWRKISNG